MRVSIHLHGILRDSIPPEARGKTTIELPEGAQVQDISAHFGFKRPVAYAVNDEVEIEDNHPLQDGDEIAVFTIIGGG